MTGAAVAAALDPWLEAAQALDPDVRRRVEGLGEAILEVHVRGLGLTLYVVPADGRVRLAAAAPDEPAVRIEGPPASLARLATTGGTQVLFGGALSVEGDVTVAKAYKRLFDTLDPDWEEALAGIVGDIAAHELGRGAGGVRAWLARTAVGRRADLRAWLVDEAELAPARAETDAWLAEVDRLRADVDRLEARLARLEGRHRDEGR
jgi:ubiquinone biosynthesis protein UbiJ